MTDTHGKNTTANNYSNFRTATRLVRGGQNRTQFRETSEAMILTSGYVYDSAEQAEASFKGDTDNFVYSRYANPTVQMFEDRLCLLEEAEACVATASGMAAVYGALACDLKAGDKVVAARALFGSCQYILADILPGYGVHTTFVDGRDLNQWEAALKGGVKAVFFETPSNPTLELIDIAAVSKLAHAAGAKVIVDNVFATPLYQSPLALGADVVTYSATKHIDGQGRCLGGAVLGSEEFIRETLTTFLKHTGPSLSPFNAWTMLKGLETLPLRVEKQCANAGRLASWLENSGQVDQVIYPGLASHPQAGLAARQMKAGSTLIAFDLGSKEKAFKLLNSLKLVDISNNLGDAKSLATHPATTTHQRLSDEDRATLDITPGLIRLSVGLEDCDDLIEDFEAALKKL